MEMFFFFYKVGLYFFLNEKCFRREVFRGLFVKGRFVYEVNEIIFFEFKIMCLIKDC